MLSVIYLKVADNFLKGLLDWVIISIISYSIIFSSEYSENYQRAIPKALALSQTAADSPFLRSQYGFSKQKAKADSVKGLSQ
jgi:hypothetical protein